MRFRPFTIGVWAALALVGLNASVGTQGFAQVNANDGRAFRLQFAKATDVATQLRTMLSGIQGPKPEILVDRRANRIIVRGPNQRLVSTLIQALDKPPLRTQQARQPMGRPEARGYQVPKGQLNDALARMKKQFPPASGARFAVDQRTGQLLVVASPQMHQKIVAALRGRNLVQNVAPQGNEDIIRLQHVTWRELEESLGRLFRDKLRLTTGPTDAISTFRVLDRRQGDAIIQVHRRLNQVSLMGPGGVTRPWRKIIQGLDTPKFAGPVQTQLVRVQRGDPNQIGQAVSTLRQAVQYMKGTAPALGTMAFRRMATTNPLIMALFQPPGGAAGAGAGRAAQPPNNNQVPIIGVDDGQGLIGDVDINFVPELGVIIIKGKKRDVARVRKMIQDILKIAAQNQPLVDIHNLKHTNAQAIAELVTTLYDQVYAPRQGPVSITSLDKPNSVLIIGQKENVKAVKDLIVKLDFTVNADTQMKVFHLLHMSAVDAEQQVRNFFTDAPGGGGGGGGQPQGGGGGGQQQGGRPGLGTRVRIISDYRSNSLIVQASPRDMSEVAHLLKLVDIEHTPATSELRIFRLKNTLATDMQPILQAAITGQSIIGTQQGQQGGQGGAGLPQQQFNNQNQQNQVTPRSTKLSIMNVDPKGNKIVESGLMADVAVTAEPNINALLIKAPAKSMPLLAELIRQLDQLPSAEAQLKVYEIKNGDATSLAVMLQQLFGLQVTIGQGAFSQQLNAFQAFAQQQGGTSSPLIPLRLAVDVRTNSIIASGSSGDLNVIEVVLLRLDEGDVETRTTEVIKLKNAPAQDVATAITNFLNSQRQITQQAFLISQISPFEQIDREVIVVPEIVSNSLIVSATPRYYDKIKKVITDLDKRPPMVMVQVIIAEVSLDDGFEFGAEFGLQDSLLFDRGIASGATAAIPGFQFNNATPGNLSTASRGSVAGQALSTFAVGRSSPSQGYGGLVLSAANESVSILVRALQDAGRMQILSRPQIMTLDNQAAFVQVGARVPRITNTTINQLGNVQNSTTDEDVGLLLRIHPFINQDGLVTMTLDTEKSEVGSPDDGIPIAITDNGPINSPLINTTTAQTTLSARSGQTVVFAGLITKNRTIRSRRIPFVSDIPILGSLFRFDTEADSRSELLIIMTPYIVKEDKDYDWIKLTESERMSWCLADVVNMDGDRGLSGGRGLWGPAPSPLIYPHTDPSGQGEVVPQGQPQPAPLPTLSNVRRNDVPKTSPRGEQSITRQVNSNRLKPTRVYYGPAPKLHVNPSSVQPQAPLQLQPRQSQKNQVSPAGFQSTSRGRGGYQRKNYQRPNGARRQYGPNYGPQQYPNNQQTQGQQGQSRPRNERQSNPNLRSSQSQLRYSRLPSVR